MKNLYQIALQTVSPIKLKKNGEAGHVGCALETVGGVVFTGICIDVPCSIGICAEQAAIAEMLKNRETKIKRIVAVYEDGSILPVRVRSAGWRSWQYVWRCFWWYLSEKEYFQESSRRYGRLF